MEDIVRNGWYWLVLIGLLSGTIGGALGVGGGVLIVPALVLGLGVSQKAAQGTSLAIMVPMALMGALRYHWNPEIKLNMGMILLLIPFAILGANLGASIAAWLPAAMLKKIFGVFVVLAGLKMMLSR